jgi:hypothetical protein
MTSSARTILRPLPGRIAAAAAGSAARRRACSGAGPASASSLSRRARIASSVPGNSRSPSAALMYRPEPPATTGTRPRASMSAMAASASSWYSATLAVRVTSHTSSR